MGLDNVWIALSADHGVAPSPAFIQEHKLGLGMAQPAAIRSAAEKALTQAFGPGPWIEDEDETYLFLNRDTLKKRNIPEAKAEEVAAQAAASQPDVAAAFTRTQFLTGSLPNSPLARKAANSFNSKRSGNVFLVFMPLRGSILNCDRHHPWNSLELRRAGAADLLGKRLQAGVLRQCVPTYRPGGNSGGKTWDSPSLQERREHRWLHR